MAESQSIEWKRTWRDDYLKWICGFANAEGGVLEIGRADDGSITGIVNARDLLETLPNKIREYLGIMVDVNLCYEEGKEYLEIRVDSYPNPISYKGEYFVRTGSTNQRLTGAALDRFMLKSYGRTWDSVPHPTVSFEDIERSLLDEFRKLAQSAGRLTEDDLQENDERLMQKLRLVDGEQLTRAGALLFHSSPDSFIAGTSIKIGYFQSDTQLLFQDEIDGGLISQVSHAIEMLNTKYLRAWISYRGVQRIETRPVPMPALREAVLNAVVHKDYASRIPIQIRVYPDKLMIWNPGRLPEGWGVDTFLGKHASIPYNPDIATVFFRAGLIESWGRGIERIMESCRNAGTPQPQPAFEANGVWMTFPFLSEHTTDNEHRLAAEATTHKSSEKGSEKGSEKSSEKIMEMIRRDPEITISEMADAIGKSTRAVEKQLASLRKSGRVTREGPDKGGRWYVRERRND